MYPMVLFTTWEYDQYYCNVPLVLFIGTTGTITTNCRKLTLPLLKCMYHWYFIDTRWYLWWCRVYGQYYYNVPLVLLWVSLV